MNLFIMHLMAASFIFFAANIVFAGSTNCPQALNQNYLESIDETMLHELVELMNLNHSPQADNDTSTSDTSTLDPLVSQTLLAQKKAELKNRFGNDRATQIFRWAQDELYHREQKAESEALDAMGAHSSKPDRIWSPQLLHKWETDEVSLTKFSPDGQLVVIGSQNSHRISVYETRSGTSAFNIYGLNLNFGTLEFSPSGKMLISISNYRHLTSDSPPLQIWSTSDGKPLIKLGEKTWWDDVTPIGLRHSHKFSVNGAIWFPDETKVLTLGSDGLAKLWDISTGKLIRNFKTTFKRVSDGVFQTRNQQILLRSTNFNHLAAVDLFDLNGQLIRQMELPNSSHSGRVSWAQNGDTLAFPAGREVIAYDTLYGQKIVRFFEGSKSIMNLRVSNRGEFLAVPYSETAFHLWDLKKRSYFTTILGRNPALGTPVFSPDDQFVISVSQLNKINFNDARTGDPKYEIDPHSGNDSIHSVQLSPDGNQLLIVYKKEASFKLELWQLFTELNKHDL